MASSVVTCVPLRTATELQVNIPGVGILRSVKQSLDDVPSPAALAMTMLAQVSPALAPFLAIMKIVDVVAQIKATFDAFKGLNPFDMANAVLALAKKIGILAEFLPGLAYVGAVRDLMALVASILRGTGELIQRWIFELQGISDALAASKILQDPELSFASDCASNRLFEVRLATQASLQDIGQLLKIIKLIVDILKSFIPLELKELDGIATAVDGIIDTIVGSGATVAQAAETARLNVLASQLESVAHVLDQLVIKISLIVPA